MHEAKVLPAEPKAPAIDWALFLFLVLFLNVRLPCKLIALVLIFVLRPDFRFGLRLPFRRDGRRSRLPLFYPAMALIALWNAFAHGPLTGTNYGFSLAGGLAYWMAGLLAIHQVKLAVDRLPATTLHRTLVAFFAINAAVSIFTLLKIMIEARTFNPYLYQGEYQKYFINTGDYIRGILFDTSSANALINAFGVLYFISRKRAGMALICMTVMLLTGSNATDIIAFCALLWMLIAGRGRERKSLALLSLFMLILFTVRISPQNHLYVFGTIENSLSKGPGTGVNADKPAVRITDMPDSLLDRDGRRMKIATRYVDSVSYLFWLKRDSVYKRLGVQWPKIRPRPRPDLDAPEFQSRLDTTLEMRKKLLEFIRLQHMEDQVAMAGEGYGRLPGKFIAMRQTIDFLRRHPGKWLFGDGMGNYSSKLAFRSTGLGMSGKYPESIRYISPEFKAGHLALYLYYFTKGPALHSVLNTPDSVYDQMLAEYGLAGVLIFVFFYLGYFCRQPGSTGIPLLFMMAIGFCLNYWFEQLSVVVVFELIMLMDRKESLSAVTKE
ncbi:MAG: hypothetical protein Q8938_00965 [Bacteroidota bacterium]|nr:hypothetical protein [Bacteroidota bacterium]